MVNQFGKNVWKQGRNLILHLTVLKLCIYLELKKVSYKDFQRVVVNPPAINDMSPPAAKRLNVAKRRDLLELLALPSNTLVHVDAEVAQLGHDGNFECATPASRRAHPRRVLLDGKSTVPQHPFAQRSACAGSIVEGSSLLACARHCQ